MQPQTIIPETSRTETSLDAVDLQAAVRRSIDSPLSALRASMEGLAGDLLEKDPRADALEGALNLVVRLTRNVRALVDYAVPAQLAPLACTVEELARTALGSLPADLQEGIDLALNDARKAILVDGPLFSRCLGYLVAANVQATDGALFSATCDEEGALFSLLCRLRARDQLHDHCEPATNGTEDENLALILAHREIARMGGQVDCSLATTGTLRVTVRMPFESAPLGI